MDERHGIDIAFEVFTRQIGEACADDSRGRQRAAEGSRGPTECVYSTEERPTMYLLRILRCACGCQASSDPSFSDTYLSCLSANDSSSLVRMNFNRRRRHALACTTRLTISLIIYQPLSLPSSIHFFYFAAPFPTQPAGPLFQR